MCLALGTSCSRVTAGVATEGPGRSWPYQDSKATYWCDGGSTGAWASGSCTPWAPGGPVLLAVVSGAARSLAELGQNYPMWSLYR